MNENWKPCFWNKTPWTNSSWSNLETLTKWSFTKRNSILKKICLNNSAPVGRIVVAIYHNPPALQCPKGQGSLERHRPSWNLCNCQNCINCKGNFSIYNVCNSYKRCTKRQLLTQLARILLENCPSYRKWACMSYQLFHLQPQHI